ncbi:MAG: hypothetical protein SV186_04850 [Candidatus Nanohaloarchaea archaeon]|nr:hypothetical protein [Candidatus Nanohaloarchaea archaeon]
MPVELLELLFAVGVAVAFLSILSGVKIELYLAAGILLLIIALIDMWGFSLVGIILAAFLIVMAAAIRVLGMYTVEGATEGANRVGEVVDQLIETRNPPQRDEDR